ncbi:MAG: hypothetical protein EU541_02735 [Promethearchaeota archaeon]|nr:MAG: hypothetical protein EU541_02735 [Candidatus Lokiarchaeota archaeon]
MKKKDLRRLLFFVVLVYSIAIIVSIVIFFAIPDLTDEFLSLIPFIVAIPAALLTRGFQKRASYISSLRGIWPKLAETGRKAIEYAEIENPTEDQYREIVLAISVSIDHLRMLFKNVGGYYPVESLKSIYEEFDKIRDIKKFKNPELARDKISTLWHQARDAILEEFDRVIPTQYIAPEFEQN